MINFLDKKDHWSKSRWVKKHKFSQQHLSVLLNQFDDLQKVEDDSSKKFSLLHLAQYLNDKKCLTKLNYQFHSNIQVFENKKLFSLSIQQFEEKMGIQYLPHLCFKNWTTFCRAFNRIVKKEKESYFSSEQKWLGFYYSKELTQGFFPNLIVQWISPRKGYGVFAGSDFKKNKFIGEYTGIVKKRVPRKDWKNAYCFEYPVCERWPASFTIDAKNQGNLTRFINHNEKANLEPMSIYSNGIVHVIFLTNRAIAKGEELVYDYGPNYWKKREKPI